MGNKISIGILGGMGPEASMYMYKMLIELSIKHFNVKNNEDFPEIILNSVPVPDFISNNKNKNIALKILKERVKDLNKLNISYLSIACNTAHLLLENLQKDSSAPFVSMIDKVAEAVKKDNIKMVGILGSPTTLRSELYQNVLRTFNIESIIPGKAQVKLLDKIIRNIIKGKQEDNDHEVLTRIADDLLARGAEGVILGCTELPIIFPLHLKIPVYNSVEILSMALLRRYYESNTINTT